jgi:hypothetical protein
MAVRSLKGDPIETSIQKSAEGFSRALATLGRFCTDNYDAIVTKTVIDLFSSIVELTPIDTGRARANWAMGMNLNVSGQSVDLTDVAEFEYKTKRGDTIWIWNNLVYIVPLEEGHSRQAPRGMVALSLRRFDKFLMDAAQQLSNVVRKR